MRKPFSAASIIAAAASLTIATGAFADDQFYSGKQITFIVGTGAGGGNDLYARVLAQHMPAHIPGKPTIVVQNMPGSNGITAASYVYTVAAKDGTVIATCPSGYLLGEAMAGTPLRFKSVDFNWVGTIATTTDLLAVWKTTGVETIEDAKKKEVIIGATSQYALSSLEPAIANVLLGTKFRLVKGYAEGGDTLNLAMERNEVEGRTNQWASWKVLRPEWVKDGKLSYLLQYGPKDPDLPDSVPTLGELVTKPEDKALVNLLEITQYVGRSVFAPPAIPEDRLKTLQTAFDATMTDPAFVKRMTELNLDLTPRKGAETKQAMLAAMGNREAVVKDLKARLNLE